MVREVIEDDAGAGDTVTAGYAFAAKKYIRSWLFSQIGFNDDGRHVPVERAVGGQVSVGFADSVAVGVVRCIRRPR